MGTNNCTKGPLSPGCLTQPSLDAQMGARNDHPAVEAAEMNAQRRAPRGPAAPHRDRAPSPTSSTQASTAPAAPTVTSSLQTCTDTYSVSSNPERVTSVTNRGSRFCGISIHNLTGGETLITNPVIGPILTSGMAAAVRIQGGARFSIGGDLALTLGPDFEMGRASGIGNGEYFRAGLYAGIDHQGGTSIGKWWGLWSRLFSGTFGAGVGVGDLHVSGDFPDGRGRDVPYVSLNTFRDILSWGVGGTTSARISLRRNHSYTFYLHDEPLAGRVGRFNSLTDALGSHAGTLLSLGFDLDFSSSTPHEGAASLIGGAELPTSHLIATSTQYIFDQVILARGTNPFVTDLAGSRNFLFENDQYYMVGGLVAGEGLLTGVEQSLQAIDLARVARRGHGWLVGSLVVAGAGYQFAEYLARSDMNSLFGTIASSGQAANVLVRSLRPAWSRTSAARWGMGIGGALCAVGTGLANAFLVPRTSNIDGSVTAQTLLAAATNVCTQTAMLGVPMQEGAHPDYDRNNLTEFETATVHFSANRATISQNAQLDRLAETLNSSPYIRRIRIRGFAADAATNEANQALAEQRANAVRSYLMSKGVTGNRLEAVGRGRPADAPPGRSTRAQDRIVDFEVLDVEE